MSADSDCPMEARHQAERAGVVATSVIRRAKMRSAALGWTTLILWLLVAGGFVAYNLVFFTFFYPLLVEIVNEGFDPSGPELDKLQEVLRVLPSVTMIWAYAWAGLVALSATCTVLYVMASRKATLSQIHAGLAEMSEQLKVLSTNATSPPAG